MSVSFDVISGWTRRSCSSVHTLYNHAKKIETFKWLENASDPIVSTRFYRFFFTLVPFWPLQKDLFLGKADPGVGASTTTTTTTTSNSGAAASGGASTTGQSGGQGSPPRSERERKLSVSSTSMKTKWLKAFRSLKPATAIASTVKYVAYPIASLRFRKSVFCIFFVFSSCFAEKMISRIMDDEFSMAKITICKNTHTRR